VSVWRRSVRNPSGNGSGTICTQKRLLLREGSGNNFKWRHRRTTVINWSSMKSPVNKRINCAASFYDGYRSPDSVGSQHPPTNVLHLPSTDGIGWRTIVCPRTYQYVSHSLQHAITSTQTTQRSDRRKNKHERGIERAHKVIIIIITIIMAPQPFVGPWPLFQFHRPTHSR
jgi:hypothetical protein